MQELKLFLKKLIGIPLLVIAFLGMVLTISGGVFLNAFWFALFIAVLFALDHWDDKRDTRNLRKAVEARGMRLDYFVNYLSNGVAIDLANEKLLVGNLKGGKILNFADVKSVEWEDNPFNRKWIHNVYVNTHDFDTPRVGAGFAGNKNMRDDACAKLSAALKLG